MPASPTPAQAEASRLNGAQSGGPASQAGKARSAVNGARHGLTGRTFFLLPDEDPAEFAAHEATVAGRSGGRTGWPSSDAAECCGPRLVARESVPTGSRRGSWATCSPPTALAEEAERRAAKALAMRALAHAPALPRADRARILGRDARSRPAAPPPARRRPGGAARRADARAGQRRARARRTRAPAQPARAPRPRRHAAQTGGVSRQPPRSASGAKASSYGMIRIGARQHSSIPLAESRGDRRWQRHHLDLGPDHQESGRTGCSAGLAAHAFKSAWRWAIGSAAKRVRRERGAEPQGRAQPSCWNRTTSAPWREVPRCSAPAGTTQRWPAARVSVWSLKSTVKSPLQARPRSRWCGHGGPSARRRRRRRGPCGPERHVRARDPPLASRSERSAGCRAAPLAQARIRLHRRRCPRRDHLARQPPGLRCLASDAARRRRRQPAAARNDAARPVHGPAARARADGARRPLPAAWRDAGLPGRDHGRHPVLPVHQLHRLHRGRGGRRARQRPLVPALSPARPRPDGGHAPARPGRWLSHALLHRRPADPGPPRARHPQRLQRCALRPTVRTAVGRAAAAGLALGARPQPGLVRQLRAPPADQPAAPRPLPSTWRACSIPRPTGPWSRSSARAGTARSWSRAWCIRTTPGPPCVRVRTR